MAPISVSFTETSSQTLELISRPASLPHRVHVYSGVQWPMYKLGVDIGAMDHIDISASDQILELRLRLLLLFRIRLIHTICVSLRRCELVVQHAGPPHGKAGLWHHQQMERQVSTDP